MLHVFVPFVFHCNSIKDSLWQELYELSEDIFSGVHRMANLLLAYTYTWNYTISGNKLISDDGQEATASINGNTMTVSANGQVMNYTKYNGTPQQLIEYLNKK